jgi:hypothetical protein
MYIVGMVNKTRKQGLFNSPKASGLPLIQYGTAEKARASIRRIAGKDATRRKQMAMRMYYRAKFNKNQTQGMRNAMKVWKKYIDSI